MIPLWTTHLRPRRPLILLSPKSLVTQLSHPVESSDALTSFFCLCYRTLWTIPTSGSLFPWFPYHCSLDAFTSVMSFISINLGNPPVLSSHCFVPVCGWFHPLTWFQLLSIHLWISNISPQRSSPPWTQDPCIWLFTEHLSLCILPISIYSYWTHCLPPQHSSNPVLLFFKTMYVYSLTSLWILEFMSLITIFKNKL